MDLVILLLYIGGMYWAIKAITWYVYRDIDNDK